MDQAREELNPPQQAYTQAVPCGPSDLACQTLVDLYMKKPGFKELLSSQMVQSGLAVPDWLSEGLSSRLVVKSIEDQPVVTGRACEPRNCAQVLMVGYGESTGRLFGLLRSHERIQWFGDPVEAEKDVLCTQDQLCSLEEKTSEIPGLLTRLELPTLTQVSRFAECTEYRGGLSTKDGFVCKEQFLPECPFATKGCTVSAQFVNQQLASISFKYKQRTMKRDELPKALARTLEGAGEETSQMDATGKNGVWVTTWQNGRVQTTLRRVKGVNALGERYDDVWLIFSDKAFSLFNP